MILGTLKHQAPAPGSLLLCLERLLEPQICGLGGVSCTSHAAETRGIRNYESSQNSDGFYL